MNDIEMQKIQALDMAKENLNEEKVYAIDEMHNGTDPQDNLYFKMNEYNYRIWAKENPNRHDSKN